MNSHAQASQDLFVLSVLKNKKDGYFVEIGSHHYSNGNNTYLLESKYNWKGIMVEYDSQFEQDYKLYRQRSIHVINDARLVNYRDLLDNNNFPVNIDYLQIDLEVENKSTLETLLLFNNTVFDKYKFATITFEHDFYRGDRFDTRATSRRIFKERGYQLVFADVSIFMYGQYNAFEDWYVHPDLVDMSVINKICPNSAPISNLAHEHFLSTWDKSIYTSFHGEVQNGRHVDQVLREYFPDYEYKGEFKGIFFDIGTFEPIINNNSYHFEKNGWECYCFEANTLGIPLLKQHRKNVFNYAISNEDKDLVIFNVSLDRTTSVITQITVPQRTLNTIIEQEIPNLPRVDIMSLDIKGGELNCLYGLDLDKYKPRVIVIKNADDDMKIDEYLRKFGYDLDKKISYNYYYISDDFRNGLEILEALYWTSSAKFNVREELKNSIIRDKLDIIVSNNIKGDPDVGKVKNLTIKYKVDGMIVKKEFKEGERINLFSFGLNLKNRFDFSPIKYIAGGQFGDFIQELSVINEIFYKYGRKGILYICDNWHQLLSCGFKFGLEHTYNDTYDIIISQKYIADYKIYNNDSNEPFDINLNDWRKNSNLHHQGWNITYKQTFNVDWGKNKWIDSEIDNSLKNKVLINTVDYRFCDNIGFHKLYSEYKDDLLFISSDEDQYNFFVNKTNLHIPFYKVTNFTMLCIAINSCKLFIGSRSAPLSIAHATFVPHIFGTPKHEPDPPTVIELPSIWNHAKYGYE